MIVDIIQSTILLFLLVNLASKESLGTLLPRTSVTKQTQQVILDSCALIDGRIIDLKQSGFLMQNLIVPQFIIHELHMLADGTDSHKRERARFGLDVIKKLQDSELVQINDMPITDKTAIDDKLVALAKQLDAQLYTTDYNLNKVAAIDGVAVLNVNELAGALRPTILPGEEKVVKIVQKGSSPNQGLGYLEDGTMLVVEDAANYVGKQVKAKIAKAHQTVAGKMLFAKLIRPPKQARAKQRAAQKQRTVLARMRKHRV